jgi:hypothetical protein
MFYAGQLTKINGQIVKVNSRPTDAYLKSHSEFTEYLETGYENEFIYRTKYKIENGKLIEISDTEIHEREYQ